MKPQPELQGEIHVKGDVKGSALSVGNNNSQNITFSESHVDGQDSAKILEALTEIRMALGGLSGPYVKSAQQSADSALNEASGDQVDKDAVGGALETALEAAKKSADFITVAAKLGPYVSTVAQWLGSSWTHLGSIL